MRLNGSVVVNAPREQVWKLFMDPVQLGQVVPGCEQVHKIDEAHYDTLMTVKVSFMTIRSKAQGTLLQTREPDYLEAELVGQPTSMAGAFRTHLTLNLVALSDTTTQINYTMELTMLGRLASLGEAIVRSTAQRISSQFSANIEKRFHPSTEH